MIVSSSKKKSAKILRSSDPEEISSSKKFDSCEKKKDFEAKSYHDASQTTKSNNCQTIKLIQKPKYFFKKAAQNNKGSYPKTVPEVHHFNIRSTSSKSAVYVKRTVKSSAAGPNKNISNKMHNFMNETIASKDKKTCPSQAKNVNSSLEISHTFNLNVNLHGIQNCKLNADKLYNSTKPNIKEPRKFSILDIDSEVINSSLTNSANIFGNREIKKFISTNTSLEEIAVTNILLNYDRLLKVNVLKETLAIKSKNLNLLNTNNQKALYLLLESKFLTVIRRIKLCIGSNSLYSIFKETLLNSCFDDLIQRIKQINIKYPNKYRIKTELSNWIFKMSLTTQLALNHLTVNLERLTFGLSEKQEVKSIIDLIFSLFAIPLSEDYMNSLLLLLSSFKAESLSKLTI